MKKIIIFNHKMSLLYDDLYNYIERTNNLETDILAGRFKIFE